MQELNYLCRTRSQPLKHCRRRAARSVKSVKSVKLQSEKLERPLDGLFLVNLNADEIGITDFTDFADRADLQQTRPKRRDQPGRASLKAGSSGAVASGLRGDRVCKPHGSGAMLGKHVSSSIGVGHLVVRSREISGSTNATGLAIFRVRACSRSRPSTGNRSEGKSRCFNGRKERSRM
jgi:hypothetical protein